MLPKQDLVIGTKDRDLLCPGPHPLTQPKTGKRGISDVPVAITKTEPRSASAVLTF